jgi:xanthine dehydrogenase accessory factor
MKENGVHSMAEFFQQLDQLHGVHQRVALATLVHTEGTSPRKEGAKMWVGEGGQMLGSVTIGGCVDAQVIEHAEEVLTTRMPRLLALPLGDEEAWEIGLSCAGTLEVFIELLDAKHPQPAALYATLRSHIEQGGAGALLTRLDGATAGAKRLLLDNGTSLGTLGSSGLDAAAVQMARDQITQGTSRTVSFALPEASTRVFIEVHSPPATLIIVGAGHVAMPLVRIAQTIGWRTLVVDSRPRFATPERFPESDALFAGIPSEIVQTLPLAPSTAVILVAHDYKFDLPVLRQVLASPVGYIGMLGSRQRGQAILKLLREEGVSDAALQRVRVPIGLDLGSRSVPEIALAILAEVVSVRYGGSNLPLSQRAGHEYKA